ncbi:MAG: hypothetical protein A3D65_01500 [Candidatus Lloydbacteria bacterium RIFCSPHIGHO2_02_FULL_50_13]|uniref:Uncharacterized protein n=1 Tax=Candidatus Lloydbacteria bacterium RIFCSPHIGHO2_02_FULL_50_13 TaxID=1798661 RepID=A0A1G2D470_9BACT|nr:MAG: hypothetical protein A3D65_01500 [Candidatus Lloydbacteria bacterium RIFCSPHIGHO2_02_FULL_50_13]
MTTEQHVSAWAKGIKDEELDTELARRKAFRDEECARRKTLAMEAQSAYFAEVYAHYTRDTWFTIANFIVALSVGSFLTSVIVRWAEYTGVFTELVGLLLLACIFALLFSPGIYFLHKERRVNADFKKKHLDHPEAPAQS